MTGKYRRRLPSAADLKARIDPLTFYRGEIGATRDPKGDGWVTWPGLCPFHQHNRPGPFRVNLQTGAFHCHACGAKGSSVIDFVMLRDGLEFKAAVDLLRQIWGGA